MDDTNNNTPTPEEETKKPSLEEMRAELKTLTGVIAEVERDIEKSSKKRSELRKQQRALIGKIETRVAAGEV